MSAPRSAELERMLDAVLAWLVREGVSATRAELRAWAVQHCHGLTFQDDATGEPFLLSGLPLNLTQQ